VLYTVFKLLRCRAGSAKQYLADGYFLRSSSVKSGRYWSQFHKNVLPPPKRRSISTTAHDVTSQKTVIFKLFSAFRVPE
jgi:hypothetical protein